VEAKAWKSIEDFYTELFDGRFLDNMVILIKHIRATGLSRRLFATTSLDTLIISIYNPIERNTEALHISYDHVSKNLLFEYYATPFISPEFIRKYSSNVVIEKFDKFIERIRW
jgi:hypothetical protein